MVDDPSTWVKAAQFGDREAFDRLVEVHGRPLLRYLQTLTGSAVNADDLAQDAWLQAYRNLASLQDPSLFRGWLLKIGYHRYLRWVRDRKPVSELKPEEFSASSGSPHAHEGLTDAVREAVRKLPEDQRTVVALRFGEGLSHAEIAEITDSEVATVRWRLFTARQTLQTILKDWK